MGNLFVKTSPIPEMKATTPDDLGREIFHLILAKVEKDLIVASVRKHIHPDVLNARIRRPNDYEDGRTLLHRAACTYTKEYFIMLQVLVEAGADLHLQVDHPGNEFHGKTAYEIAESRRFIGSEWAAYLRQAEEA